MKKVLIAHQSTIPHYRVDFYNALEQARPPSWSFEVIFDTQELQKKRLFKENIDTSTFCFPTVNTRTFSLAFSEKRLIYQSFWKTATRYDLIVVGSALQNLTYPLCWLHRFNGKKFAIWGHGRDRSVVNPRGFKLLQETIRLSLARNADGFFAYTPDIKQYLEKKGVIAQNIFVLNNTVDIHKQRRYFTKYIAEKQVIKQQLGIAGKKTILFVGRFTKNKRIAFLLDAFSALLKKHSDYHLLLVGSGSEEINQAGHPHVTGFGPVTDLDQLAPIYVASEVFAFPGDVGLGPLQALCFDLPVITIDAPTHMPEFGYLSAANSVILPFGTSPKAYADALANTIENAKKLQKIKTGIWPSIAHLTIENMAKHFVEGVNHILGVN